MERNFMGYFSLLSQVNSLFLFSSFAHTTAACFYDYVRAKKKNRNESHTKQISF